MAMLAAFDSIACQGCHPSSPCQDQRRAPGCSRRADLDELGHPTFMRSGSDGAHRQIRPLELGGPSFSASRTS
jgi:hypothetical protein